MGKGREATLLYPEKDTHPVAHLPGGFVCKGDGEDTAGADPVFYQMVDTVCECPCFARPRSGDDEHGPVFMRDGFTLGRV